MKNRRQFQRSGFVLTLLVITLLFAVYGKTTVNRASAQGTMLADSGFRPATDGFAFQNYTNSSVQQNLTPVEMKRMFGEQVCADQNDPCTLTPPAQQVMDEVNKIMDGGHCEGMAALSIALYAQKMQASQFGGDTTPALKLETPELQRELAYFFTTQVTSPTKDNKVKDKTPSEIVDLLVEAMKDGKNATEFYTIGFFKRGFKDGHAVTPYAVSDMGNNLIHIMIYDNNFPSQERFIEVDRGANTWKYSAAASPDVPESLYEGDAESKTLFITPSAPRFEQQVCFFCAAAGTSKVMGSAYATQQFNRISLTSDSKENEANLLITDAAGHKIGYEGDKFVNDFPGADFTPVVSSDLWSDNPEPIYSIPVGVAFTITLDGSQLKGEETSDVSMVGPGYDLAVEGIKLDPKQVDTITFSPDGRIISYKTTSNEAPNIVIGVEHTGADYEFEIKGADLDGGGTINVGLDSEKGQLAFKTSDSKSPATYELSFSRIGDKGPETFTHDGLTLDPGDTAFLDFSKWEGNGKPLTIEIDKGSDGSVDSTGTQDDSK